MLRVLHISSGNLYGGIETLLFTLARHRHTCRSLEHHFALCFNGRLSRELTAMNVPLYLMNEVRTSRPWTVWRARRRLRSLLQRERFDVVICHAAWPQAIFGPVVRSQRLPLAFWMHDATDGQHWVEKWARRTVPQLVICNSAFTATRLPSLYRDAPSVVIYVPVSQPAGKTSGRAEVRNELGTAPDTVVLIQTSRMQAWKGQQLHLAALGMLRDVSGWECWQVGGAQNPDEVQYVRQLQDEVVQQGIADRVRFLGQRSDVTRLLAAADIHCQPNLTPEPFGIAFIEALYAGLPVVTTALGGPLEIVDDSCGILVPPHDMGALSGALRQLIESPGLRARLSAAGPERASRLCEPEQQLSSLKQALQQIVN